MAIVRINHFVAQEGDASALYEKLSAVVPMILNMEGCTACRILAEDSKPEHIVILEEWTSSDAHKAALAAVPPETFQTVMPLLAEPPSGAYYS